MAPLTDAYYEPVEDLSKRSNQPRLFKLLAPLVQPGDPRGGGWSANGVFDRIHIPGLLYAAHNTRADCGHIRLFGRPNRGIAIYTYNAGVGEEWATHRVWNFGLFALHHISDGLHTDPAGWHWTFAGIRITRRHGEIALCWHGPDTYRTRRRR